MMLVFCGVNARRELSDLVGRLEISSDTGETIRDTFGDLVRNDDGSVRYFEPAVICSDSERPVGEDLALWIDFARHESPVLDRICHYDHPEQVEKTLVMIKPDSWRQGSARPGTIIGMFSRTGLRMIACTKVNMTLEQAQEFYGPVKDILRKKLAPGIGSQAKEFLERRFDLQLPECAENKLVDCVGIPFAEKKFDEIVEFMSGLRPDGDGGCLDLHTPKGHIGVLALVYEGEDAVAKIREVLGPTDPTEAPEGTVRREFGSDVMVNTAHASDNPENAEREMRILNMYKSSFVAEVAPLLEQEQV
jgi:nucleoside diphosphate kinase